MHLEHLGHQDVQHLSPPTSPAIAAPLKNGIKSTDIDLIIAGCLTLPCEQLSASPYSHEALLEHVGDLGQYCTVDTDCLWIANLYLHTAIVGAFPIEFHAIKVMIAGQI